MGQLEGKNHLLKMTTTFENTISMSEKVVFIFSSVLIILDKMVSIILSHVNSTFLDMEIMFTKVDVNFKRWFFIFQSTHVD